MKKSISIILALTLCLGLFAGCGSKAQETEAPASDETEASAETEAPAEEGGVIGVIISDTTTEFFTAINDGILEVAEPAGYEVVTLNSANDASKDVTNMEDILSQNPSVIIYNPVDSDAAPDVVKMANDAGIPVVTVDRGSNGGEIACHIASDNVYGGELAAQYIVDALGADGGQVVEIQGQAGASATNDRGKGFHNIVDAQDNIEVVVSQTGNWSTAEAMTVMENAMTAFPDVKAVFCHNDAMALGVVEACTQAGRDDIIIVGFDADADNIAAIKAGTQDATIQQLPSEMGNQAGEIAISIIKGESVETVIGVEVALINADNAQ